RAIARVEDPRIAAGSLGGPVAAQVGVGAMLIVLAVGLVLLFVVTDQVVQREAIVARNEVDARVGGALRPLIDVRRTREPGRERGDLPLVALPEAPHRIAVLAVPLR